MNQISKKTVSSLLQIYAIKLNPARPFTWASGIKSPIYCDNRQTLSYPEIRTFLKNAFADLIRQKYPDVELIAGVATGGIALGALVADALELPFVYVRSSGKQHGLNNQIEGYYQEKQKVVVIEDLVSTGGSSLAAVEALQSAGTVVLGMLAIFTYELDAAIENFKKANCQLDTLGDYSTLIEQAVEQNYISPEQLETLRTWRNNPKAWAAQFGA